MFITNPDSFLLPSYRISPFQTDYIGINHNLKEDNYAFHYFNKRFGKHNWQYTVNGRESIKLALQSYNLDKNDLVTILTTSENFYISSCVTKEIEKICQWNRELSPQTKIIFINHEFGYPYPDLTKITELGLPIIEDCCTTFFSQDQDLKVGSYGDFSLYSFPKFFPIQIGGLVVSNKNNDKLKKSQIDDLSINYIEKVISYNLRNEEELIKKRTENFEYAISLYSKEGFQERFEGSTNVVPSSLILKNNFIIKDLHGLKLHLANHGIQSSIFYGEDAFFIPCHQNMSKFDIDYIFSSILNFKYDS